MLPYSLMSSPSPLIVQGAFRSGTTALFRVLRHDPGLQCYYEPLHPNLLDHVEEADKANATHPKSSLYREFRDVPNLRQSFCSSFAGAARQVQWGKTPVALRQYLRRLIQAAPYPSMLQFNRAFWMVPCLGRLFPQAVFVHMVRDPRSVVWSRLTTACGGRARLSLPWIGKCLPLSSGNLLHVFSKYARFSAYNMHRYFAMGREIVERQKGAIFQRLKPIFQRVDSAAPYVKALALWAANVHICHHQAHHWFGSRYVTIRYEDFCQSHGAILREIYGPLERPIPKDVLRSAETTIRSNRLRKWTGIRHARERFAKGIEKAKIGPIMDDFRYSR